MASKWFGVGAFAVVAAACSTAFASDFYGINTDGVISRFDMTAQTVTPLASIHAGPTTPTGFQDLAFDGAGNLYAMRNYFDFNTFSAFNELYRVTNPTTGTALLSGSMGNNSFHSLAFRSSDSSFYSVNNVNGQVGTLSTSGAFTAVSGVGNGPRNLVNALAINPVDGQAYGLIDMGIAIIGTIDYTLVRTDMTTGLSTIIGSLGVTTDIFNALRFDETGAAYTVGGFTGDVYKVNTTTGAASFQFAGGTAARNTNGLALIAVPAPGGVAALVLGVATVTRRRRR